jgi:uncharacterized membrane protein YidH (DUF202 family)
MPSPKSQPPVTDPANRTRLAWTRTALAFAAIGGIMLKLSPVTGLVVLALSLPIWAVAHRRGTTVLVPAPRRLRLVTTTVVIVAIAALVIAIFGRSPSSLGQLLRGR